MIYKALKSPDSAKCHMNADQNLGLAAHTEPQLRLYTWDHPAVTVGRFQDPASCLGPDCNDFALRPSGGLAVLHGHDLTVTIAAEYDRRESWSPRKVYWDMAGVIRSALILAGLDAAFGGSSSPSASTGIQNCFLTNGAYDMIDLRTGEKICGCALHLQKCSALLQSSIPVNDPIVDPERWINGSRRQRVIPKNQGTLIECLEICFLDWAAARSSSAQPV